MADGRGKHKHTYCHLSKYLVKDGAKVKEGDPIAVTGKTGLATGIHLHHVYYPRGDGRHADIEKALNKESEEDMVTKRGLEVIYRFRLGQPPSEYGLKNYLGKVTFDEADKRVRAAELTQKRNKESASPAYNYIAHLPSDMRKLAYNHPEERVKTIDNLTKDIVDLQKQLSNAVSIEDYDKVQNDMLSLQAKLYELQDELEAEKSLSLFDRIVAWIKERITKILKSLFGGKEEEEDV